jgi:hypothetical protein
MTMKELADEMDEKPATLRNCMTQSQRSRLRVTSLGNFGRGRVHSINGPVTEAHLVRRDLMIPQRDKEYDE